MGNEQRFQERQLMLSLFDKEATYDIGPSAWTAGSACSMKDFRDSVQDEWPDELGDNRGQVGSEFATRQEILRRSARIPYTTDQAKPNELAGLIGLNLGTVVSVQDAALTAYRHKLTKAAAYSLPSIGAQLKHEGGRQYRYYGVKGDGFTLSQAGGYMSLEAPLLGSGTRATAADAFAAAISEDPVLWANASIFVKAVTSAISIPATPAQGSANLGGSEVNLSTRVLEYNLNWNNALNGPGGYRAGSKARQMLKASPRSGTLRLSVEVDQTTEAAQLDYYLNQSDIAVELNIDSGTIIAATGAFKFGMIAIIPQVRFKSLGKSVVDGYEALNFEGEVMNDETNSELVVFVYNAQSVYLA